MTGSHDPRSPQCPSLPGGSAPGAAPGGTAVAAPQDTGEAQAEAGPLSEDTIRQFHEQGFLIERGVIGADICRRMRLVAEQHLAAQIEPIEYEAETGYPGAPSGFDAPGGRTIRRLKQAHARDFVFTEYLMSDAIRLRMRQLLGTTPVVPLAHHNCIMTKHPRYSSDTGWHQDIRYWAFREPELISVWLALGDETPANGCLQLIPGSHRLRLERHRFDDRLFFRDDLPENRSLIEQAVSAELRAGDVLFFHCRTLHAASRNRSDATKFSVVFTFRRFDNPPIRGTRSASLPEMILPD